MKFYKKALVASAIIGSFAAQAVTIAPSTQIELSAEGVALGVAPTAADVAFDIVVEAAHPATTEITLTFDKNVDLNGLLGGVCVANAPTGSGTSDTCGDVTFSYGNGNFTFDNVVITEAATAADVDEIKFEVSTGNAITAFSSFGVELGGTKVLISGATNLSYYSEYNSAEVESGTFPLATEKNQFSFALTTQFNGVIERELQTTFINGNGADSLAYTVVNDETLGLIVPEATVEVAVSGNFEDVDLFTATSGAVETPVPSIEATAGTEFDTLTSTYVFPATSSTKLTNNEVWTFTGPMTGGVIPQTGSTSLTAKITASTDAAVTTALGTAGYALAENVDSGEWILDAVTINVPYFPINYADTNTSVHIANEASTDADVIVTAIDNNGVEYGPLNLGFKANGNTVTKVSQNDIATLFAITDATKLSVTFNLDADEENVSAYAFSQNAKGKSEISNSQLKGEK